MLALLSKGAADAVEPTKQEPTRKRLKYMFGAPLDFKPGNGHVYTQRQGALRGRILAELHALWFEGKPYACCGGAASGLTPQQHLEQQQLDREYDRAVKADWSELALIYNIATGKQADHAHE